MKIIAIEGLDKSGKHSISKELEKHLILEGYKVVQSEFHRYDTPTGKIIASWLHEKSDLDGITIEYLMSADKQAQQSWFSKLEEKGVDFLILDRYVSSQTCYALAKGHDSDWIENLQKFMRKPDFEILLDISPEVSMSRKGKHGDNDRYERNYAFLTDVRSNYIEHFKKAPSSRVILDTSSKSINEIAEIVVHEVQNKLLDHPTT